MSSFIRALHFCCLLLFIVPSFTVQAFSLFRRTAPASLLERDDPSPGSFRVPVSVHSLDGGSQAQLQKRDSGPVDVPANLTEDGYAWKVPVSIGGQNFTLRLNFVSSDTWVASTLLKPSNQTLISSGNIYDNTKSPTYKNTTGYQWEYSRGNQFIEGPLGTDTFSVGGASVKNLTFGLARTLYYRDDWSTYHSTDYTDGDLALGFQGDQETFPISETPTFVEAFEPKGAQRYFTTNLKKNNTGFIEFGKVDKTAYRGNITVIDIHNQSALFRWRHPGVKFATNNTVFNNTYYSSVEFNPAQSGISVTSTVLDSYFTRVPGKKSTGGGYTYPCGQTLPDLQMVFNASTVRSGPSTVSVPGYLLADDDTTNATKTMCNPKLVGNGYSDSDVGNYFITGAQFGAPFFLSKYVIFNYTGPSMGIADQAN